MGAQFNCLISEELGGKGASGELYLTWPTAKHLDFNSFAQLMHLKPSKLSKTLSRERVIYTLYSILIAFEYLLTVIF